MGRLSLRWKKGVEYDLSELKLQRWRQKTNYRENWVPIATITKGPDSQETNKKLKYLYIHDYFTVSKNVVIFSFLE
jgi:hypothetical protein